MSLLKVYNEESAKPLEEHSDFESIQSTLKTAGVIFERWQASHPISDSASQEKILKVYSAEIERLKKERGFITEDVISINPNVPNHRELRKKFLSEHVHSDDEARFFIDGMGLFCIHTEGKVFQIRCQKNDLVNVPAYTPHWFDMGNEPYFKCIRVYTNKEGWVAEYTGSKIADIFPKFEGEWLLV